MAVVKLDRLTKYYDHGSAPAVDDVSLLIEDGEFMVLLGPSGCGKSTTLRMIAGLESITQGELSIDGRVVNNVAAKDRDIAMVFQSYALYPHMNVRDNLSFGLKRRGIPRADIQTRVTETAGLLGLTPYLDRKPFALSGGQRQRVALGRAIVRDPKVFLLDEPLSNLDAALRVSTRGELIKQHQRLGTTMIYVTHDQVEAMTMGSRICIMEGGRIAQVGRPMDVYRYPADTFVARFLGSPGMNLVAAETEAEGDSLTLHIGESRLSLPMTAPLSDGFSGGTVTLGVRPEDLYETPRFLDGATLGKFSGRVSTVEPLGADTLVQVELAGCKDEVVARFGSDVSLRAGEPLVLNVDLRAIRLFDADSGKALTSQPGMQQGSCPK